MKHVGLEGMARELCCPETQWALKRASTLLGAGTRRWWQGERVGGPPVPRLGRQALRPPPAGSPSPGRPPPCPCFIYLCFSRSII